MIPHQKQVLKRNLVGLQLINYFFYLVYECFGFFKDANFVIELPNRMTKKYFGRHFLSLLIVTGINTQFNEKLKRQKNLTIFF